VARGWGWGSFVPRLAQVIPGNASGASSLDEFLKDSVAGISPEGGGQRRPRRADFNLVAGGPTRAALAQRDPK